MELKHGGRAAPLSFRKRPLRWRVKAEIRVVREGAWCVMRGNKDGGEIKGGERL